MFNLKRAQAYWREQTKNGNNPCHYHNYWQDHYAFHIRTKAFRKEDFGSAEKIIDIGCGVGDYTNYLTQLGNGRFLGFDFDFNVAIARQRHRQNPRLEFRIGTLPDQQIQQEIATADIVLTTTVYVHLAREAREAFLNYSKIMKVGSRVMLLEYAPETIPDFQKNLSYKEVETPSQIIEKFSNNDFQLIELRPVNFIDSFFFFYLGKNFWAYYLTLASERLLKFVKFPQSKYKLFIFQKIR